MASISSISNVMGCLIIFSLLISKIKANSVEVVDGNLEFITDGNGARIGKKKFILKDKKKKKEQ